MPYRMNPAQLKSVAALDGPARYQHFIGKVADWQEVWSLKNSGGFVALGADDGRRCIPFWPHPDYAAALAVDSWKDCTPERIELSRFLNAWLPGMKDDGVFAAIFPTEKGKAVVVDPLDLKNHLAKENAQYE